MIDDRQPPTDDPRRPNLGDVGDVAKGMAGVARDAGYIAVGFGVLGLQKALVHRESIQHWLETQSWLGGEGSIEDRLGDVRTEVARHADHLDGVVERALHQVEASLAPLEAQLPEPARAIAQRAHAQAHDVRVRIKELLFSE
jgi:hypothetical protein